MGETAQPSDSDVSHAEGTATESHAGVVTFGRWFLIVVPPTIAALYIWQVIALPSLTHEPIIPPRAWPLLVSVVLCAGALVISAGAALRRWGMVSHDAGADIGSRRDLIVTLVLTVVFAVVLEPFGYVLSAFLLVGALSMLVSPARWMRNLIVAALFAVASSALFSGLLGVRLPDGLIPLPWS